MITPVDIQSKAFKSGIGYDKRDVDGFIGDVLASYEELYRSNVEMKDKITILNESLQHYKTLEASLEKALMLAEKTSEETLKTAEYKAKSIELEAINKAKAYTADSKLELERVHNQTVVLVQQYTKFKAQFTQLINTQAELLNSAKFDMSAADMASFAGTTATANDMLNASSPIDDSFGSFSGDAQTRETSPLGGAASDGGLGGGLGNGGSSFSADPYEDPRTTSAGSELSGVSLLKTDPFESTNASPSASSTSSFSSNINFNTNVVAEPKVEYTAPVKEEVKQAEPINQEVKPEYTATTPVADTTEEAPAEEYGDDVYVGEIEEKVDRRTLIGNYDSDDEGFEFI